MKVYAVVAVLFILGDHDPAIPLFDVVGSGLNGSPLQIAAIGVNVGLGELFTVMVIVVVFPHWPLFGVKV